MILILHILSALTSLVLATLLFFAPSTLKFRLSCGLVGVTLASGTYLIFSSHSHLLSSCLTGLVYLAGVSALLAVAHRRYAHQLIKSD